MFPTDAARCGLPPIVHRGKTFLPRQLHLTGWRWLMEYRTTEDEWDTLFGDVPANHGLYTPLAFDPPTGALLGDTSLDWWADNLPALCRGARREDAPLGIEVLRSGLGKVIFLNTLDYVFGHSLLLLLNAGVYLDRYPDHGLIVVVSPELRRFVPAGVAEVWTLHVPPGETRQWHANLDAHIAARAAASHKRRIPNLMSSRPPKGCAPRPASTGPATMSRSAGPSPS